MNSWTVFDHPADYPDYYVARRFVIRPGEVQATDELLIYPLLGPLQRELQDRGLYRIPRDPADDPVIIETWL